MATATANPQAALFLRTERRGCFIPDGTPQTATPDFPSLLLLPISVPLRLCSEKKATGFRLQATGFRLQATALVLVLVLVLVLGFSSFRVSRGLMSDCGKSSSVFFSPAA